MQNIHCIGFLPRLRGGLRWGFAFFLILALRLCGENFPPFCSKKLYRFSNLIKHTLALSSILAYLAICFSSSGVMLFHNHSVVNLYLVRHLSHFTPHQWLNLFPLDARLPPVIKLIQQPRLNRLQFRGIFGQINTQMLANQED